MYCPLLFYISGSTLHFLASCFFTIQSIMSAIFPYLLLKAYHCFHSLFLQLYLFYCRAIIYFNFAFLMDIQLSNHFTITNNAAIIKFIDMSFHIWESLSIYSQKQNCWVQGYRYLQFGQIMANCPPQEYYKFTSHQPVACFSNTVSCLILAVLPVY